MRILAIDPGISSGWSLFDDRELVACGAGVEKSVPIERLPFDSALIELPEIYEHTHVNPENILTLTRQVGRYEQRILQRNKVCTFVRPKQWKGQTPKEIHNSRVMRAVCMQPDVEPLVIQAMQGLNRKAKSDLIDAIGLGFYAATGLKL